MLVSACNTVLTYSERSQYRTPKQVVSESNTTHHICTTGFVPFVCHLTVSYESSGGLVAKEDMGRVRWAVVFHNRCVELQPWVCVIVVFTVLEYCYNPYSHSQRNLSAGRCIGTTQK